MAVTPEVEALLCRTYHAFNRKDVETALAAAHPEVHWPNVLEGRWVVGVREVRAYWMRQFQVIDLQLEPLEIFEDDDGSVVARVHQVVRFTSDGQVIADEVVDHIFTFEDGQIVAVDARDAQGNLVSPSRSSAGS